MSHRGFTEQLNCYQLTQNVPAHGVLSCDDYDVNCTETYLHLQYVNIKSSEARYVRT
jgi:hypothetical protein